MRVLPCVVGLIAVTFGSAYVATQTQTPRDAPAQPASRQIPVGSGVISGVVISAETGRPLRNARVSLNGTAGAIPAGRGMTPPTPDNPGPPTMSVSRTAFTDAQGQFSFARVAGGRYSVSVSRDGYLQASFGQQRPNSGTYPAIELADGGQRSISIALSRGGVVAGRVTDEDGEPVRGVQVQLWRMDRSNGSSRMQQTQGVQTNDRGDYRIFGLQPGTYAVSAVPSNNSPSENTRADIAVVEQAIAKGRMITPAQGPAYVIAPPPAQSTGARVPTAAYLPVYFPGTVVARGAGTIAISDGEQHEGLDITLQFVRAGIVKGVISPAPQDGTFVQVGLTSLDSPLGNTSTGVNQADGTFTFNNVAPGRYTIQAMTMVNGSRIIDAARVVVDGAPLDSGARIRVERVQQSGNDDSRMWGLTEVFVGDSATVEVVLSLRPALTLSGTVTFDMAQPPNLPNSQLTLQVAPLSGAQLGSVPPATVAKDGTFIFKGIMPGRYFVRAPWWLRSATLSGRDVLELPIEVSGEGNITGLELTATDKFTEVIGTLTDSSGNPIGNHVVVIAPANEGLWVPGSRRIMTATTGPYGRYTFRLPPGDYIVSPVEGFENGTQYDREFLAALSGTGAKVRLEESGSVRRDFQIR